MPDSVKISSSPGRRVPSDALSVVVVFPMSWQRSQPTGLWMLPPVEGPVRNVEPSGRVPALRGDQLMKARIKQRIGVTDSHRDAIDHPVEQKETAPAFATESARFGALPWCEYESRFGRPSRRGSAIAHSYCGSAGSGSAAET